jgi:hypothetical protein
LGLRRPSPSSTTRSCTAKRPTGKRKGRLKLRLGYHVKAKARPKTKS